ncbi:hypothetical protein HDU76_001081, partial [Blyttiomyces sp. JEL0837]
MPTAGDDGVEETRPASPAKSKHNIPDNIADRHDPDSKSEVNAQEHSSKVDNPTDNDQETTNDLNTQTNLPRDRDEADATNAPEKARRKRGLGADMLLAASEDFENYGRSKRERRSVETFSIPTKGSVSRRKDVVIPA